MLTVFHLSLRFASATVKFFAQLAKQRKQLEQLECSPNIKIRHVIVKRIKASQISANQIRNQLETETIDEFNYIEMPKQSHSDQTRYHFETSPSYSYQVKILPASECAEYLKRQYDQTLELSLQTTREHSETFLLLYEGDSVNPYPWIDLVYDGVTQIWASDMRPNLKQGIRSLLANFSALIY